jgi:hypothetical protein
MPETNSGSHLKRLTFSPSVQRLSATLKDRHSTIDNPSVRHYDQPYSLLKGFNDNSTKEDLGYFVTFSPLAF